jgi:hypothetical protein
MWNLWLGNWRSGEDARWPYYGVPFAAFQWACCQPNQGTRCRSSLLCVGLFPFILCVNQLLKIKQDCRLTGRDELSMNWGSKVWNHKLQCVVTAGSRLPCSPRQNRAHTAVLVHMASRTAENWQLNQMVIWTLIAASLYGWSRRIYSVPFMGFSGRRWYEKGSSRRGKAVTDVWCDTVCAAIYLRHHCYLLHWRKGGSRWTFTERKKSNKRYTAGLVELAVCFPESKGSEPRLCKGTWAKE